MAAASDAQPKVRECELCRGTGQYELMGGRYINCGACNGAGGFKK